MTGQAPTADGGGELLFLRAEPGRAAALRDACRSLSEAAVLHCREASAHGYATAATGLLRCDAVQGADDAEVVLLLAFDTEHARAAWYASPLWLRWEAAAGRLFERPYRSERLGDPLFVPRALPADGEGRGHAVVFIEPAAATAKAVRMVRRALLRDDARTHVDGEGRVSAEACDRLGVADRHHRAAARYAQLLPDELPFGAAGVPAAAAAGLPSWVAAPRGAGDVISLGDALSVFPHKTWPEDLARRWRAGARVTLAPGAELARVNFGSGDGMDDAWQWLCNGWYGAARRRYTHPGRECTGSLHYWLVSFPEEDDGWRRFLRDTVGVADGGGGGVAAAPPPGSLRARLFDAAEELGLRRRPPPGTAGIHASSGPVEALLDRRVWAGVRLGADPFGQRLLRLVDVDRLEDLLASPEVERVIARLRGCKEGAAAASVAERLRGAAAGARGGSPPRGPAAEAKRARSASRGAEKRRRAAGAAE